MKNDRKLSRRRFIGEASCAAAGSTALFASLLNLRMASTAAAADLGSEDDYKALVCLFLQGGNDSFNMLAPHNQNAYDDYAETRDNLALPREACLPIASEGQPFSEFGIHPSMPRLQELYNNQDLAFIANVGTLIEPIKDKSEYNKNANLRPGGLFSHSDQQIHWQTSMPQIKGTSPGGWGGRTADLLNSMNENAQVSMNISLSGVNVFQTGNEVFSYTSGIHGGTQMVAYSDPFEKAAVDSALELGYKNLFTSTFAENTRRFIDSSILFNNAIEDKEITVQPDAGSRLASRMKMIARTIAAHKGLNHKRQTFFIRSDGWDHHNEVLNAQEYMLADIDVAIKYFKEAMDEIGMSDKVILFTASDFGRTLTSNGRGSDHAWGGNQFVLGGPVNGGRIFGQYPPLDLSNSLMLDRGRIIPTTSVDEYGSELARWLGVSGGEMDTVFPNIQNFYDPAQITHPLGFLS